MHATAGSLIGIGEIVLLPLDVLKIKRQTNPEAFRGRGIMKIVADEGFALYRGWGWTAARNAPGSFAVCLSDVHITVRVLSIAVSAVRSISIYKRVRSRPARLLIGDMGTERYRVKRRIYCINHYLPTPRCHQDSCAKPKVCPVCSCHSASAETLKLASRAKWAE